ncbi:hypothetical protein QQS21_004227, partial [Conoideocrella luteorostrata]
MVKRLVTEVNCFTFFGRELSENAEFTAAALEFLQTVIMTAEFLRTTQNFMKLLVATIVTRRHRAAKTLYQHLEPIVTQRLAKRRSEDNTDVPVDCMQWLIDNISTQDPLVTGSNDWRDHGHLVQHCSSTGNDAYYC